MKMKADMPHHSNINIRSELLPDNRYDLAIAGGGLAGLSLAIQAATAGLRVILFEKESYPFHRVCGEYISMESYPFLESLGLPLSDLSLPHITKLRVSAPNGKMIEHPLSMGGFGISRYVLDYRLSIIAKEKGVRVLENTRVMDIHFDKNDFSIESSAGNFTATAAAGTFGKRSNLDIKWQRNFTMDKPSALNNFIGVKYHVKTEFRRHYRFIISRMVTVAFRPWKKSIACYLTSAWNLRKNNNSIKKWKKMCWV
jgi:flavin-dependent dehydrogenase